MINYRGRMKKYLKDFHGDPKSPINGNLGGLFFSVNMDKRTGRPPTSSIYGEERLLISPDRMIQRFHNIYFTDFYCINDAHYVTLVMTKTGSKSDLFCQQYLIRMSLNIDNEICHIRVNGGKLAFMVTSGLWVEIMITENIDINYEVHLGAMFESVHMKGNRSGGRVGLQKNRNCKVCNIWQCKLRKSQVCVNCVSVYNTKPKTKCKIICWMCLTH